MRMRQYVLLLICVLAATPASAQARESALQDEAVKWLQAYLRVDTINPPGNEAAGVQFFKAILDAEGIAVRDGGIGAGPRQYLGAPRRAAISRR